MRMLRTKRQDTGVKMPLRSFIRSKALVITGIFLSLACPCSILPGFAILPVFAQRDSYYESLSPEEKREDAFLEQALYRKKQDMQAAAREAIAYANKQLVLDRQAYLQRERAQEAIERKLLEDSKARAALSENLRKRQDSVKEAYGIKAAQEIKKQSFMEYELDALNTMQDREAARRDAQEIKRRFAVRDKVLAEAEKVKSSRAASVVHSGIKGAGFLSGKGSSPVSRIAAAKKDYVMELKERLASYNTVLLQEESKRRSAALRETIEVKKQIAFAREEQEQQRRAREALEAQEEAEKEKMAQQKEREKEERIFRYAEEKRARELEAEKGNYRKAQAALALKKKFGLDGDAWLKRKRGIEAADRKAAEDYRNALVLDERKRAREELAIEAADRKALAGLCFK